ncbi:MAG: LysR substrate-binding domain-containing protein [Bacteroidota bacterium]
MNIKQLEYVVSLAEQRHFERAAEKCFVSQSTLSTMIGRLEDELGLLLFDRTKKPISVTKEGEALLGQIRMVLKDLEMLSSVVQEIKGEVSGELSIAAIPTVAPFLLPRVLWKFAKRFPKVKIEVRELITQHIEQGLLNREIDMGITATPTHIEDLSEHILYEEPFYLFDYDSNNVKANINLEEINYDRMYLLEDGHCLSSQIENVCSLSHRHLDTYQNVNFKAGSIDSLIRIVKMNKGLTLLPKLATFDFNENEKKRLSQFNQKTAARTVRLVVHKHFVKQRLLETFLKEIKQEIAPYLT